MRQIIRLIDANINRSLEGLRVAEDINRFIFNDKLATKLLKDSRHALIRAMAELPFGQKERLKERDIAEDVGKVSNKSELSRKNHQEIYFINLQRAKESLRVLEEFSKLYSAKVSGKLKKLRYALYAIEKKSFKGF
jgi:thiamine-phosphate pyrophosphorylase